MKTQTYNSLGLEVPFQVPESVTEFDTNAKREGACLAEAINNIIYRGSLAEFRDVFLHGRKEDKEKGIAAVQGVDDLTGIERNTKPVMKNGKPVVKDNEPVVEYSESEADYFKRVCGTLVENGSAKDVDAAKMSFLSHATSIASGIEFDASATERKATGPKKLAQKYKDFAKRLLDGPNMSRFGNDVKSALGKDIVLGDDADKNIETVGWLVKALAEYKERQTLEAIVS